jgi:hypothetical protein
MTSRQFVAVDAATTPWEERFNEWVGRTLYRKILFADSETGVMIALVRYPAGVLNPGHTHPCGHGMYQASSFGSQRAR